MRLDDDQVRHYNEHGFLLVEGGLSQPLAARVEEMGQRLLASSGACRVLEKDGRSVRSVNGFHLDDPFFAALVRDPALLDPAVQLLGSPAYVHQSKLNVKAALGGDLWEWHQDFFFWHRLDGLPRPEALTAAIFLDPADDLNGPVLLAPGSHRMGLLETTTRGDGDWSQDLSASLRFPLRPEALFQALAACGIRAAKGGRGSILFFHCCLLHGSSVNMSARDRRMLFLTYNAAGNRPTASEPLRPAIVASRDWQPLLPASGDPA